MKRLALLLAALATACLADSTDLEPDPADPCAPRPGAVDPAGDHHRYVVDRIDLPGSSTEAVELALDVDGNDRADNAFGQLLAVIDQLADDYDLDAEVAMLIDSGALLHLIDVQATALDQAEAVGVIVLHGRDTDGDPTDNLDGGETFAIDAGRGQGTLTGRVIDGALSVEVGEVPLAVAFPGLPEPFILPLIGARIEAEIGPDGLTGRIAGGITREAIDGALLPALHEGLTRIVARDCPAGACEASSFGSFLLEQFDHDGDGELALEELRDDELVRGLLAPDVDLLGEDGRLAFSCDGEKDSLSIAVGFTAVPASF